MVQAFERETREQVDALLTYASRAAGEGVSARQLRSALRELDRTTLREAGAEIVAGRPDGARDVLAASTSLSDAQIDAIVKGVENDVEDKIEAMRERADQVLESAASYVQGVLWAAFVAGALGLCACIFGGMMGAGTVERLVTVRVSRTVR